MRTFKVISLLSMAVLAGLCVVTMFLFEYRDTALRFFGFYTAMAILILDLIMAGSILLVLVLFKSRTIGQILTRTLLGTVGGLIALLIIFVALNPLRFPRECIRFYILQLTPIGTNMERVIEVIESKENWETRYISYESGYDGPGPLSPEDIALGKTRTVGEKSIEVYLGEYQNIFVTSVTVFWGFDKDSKLIDIYIWKDMDSM